MIKYFKTLIDLANRLFIEIYTGFHVSIYVFINLKIPVKNHLMRYKAVLYTKNSS